MSQRYGVSRRLSEASRLLHAIKWLSQIEAIGMMAAMEALDWQRLDRFKNPLIIMHSIIFSYNLNYCKCDESL